MSGGKRQYAAPSATPWDGMPGDSMTPAETAVMLSHRSMYDYRHSALSAEREVAFFNGYLREECPRCHSKLIEGNGRDRNGVRRWRCKSCGSVLHAHDRHDLPGPQAARLRLARVPAADLLVREHKRHDEGKPQVGDHAALLGLGCDAEGRSVFVPCGRGKPSKARAWEAYGSHIAEGSTLSHDMERSHSVLVERLSLVSVEHDARKISRMPDRDNPLREVNRLCFLLETFLNSHSGFDRDDLPGWLNLFHVMMNDPEDKRRPQRCSTAQ